MYYGTSSKLKAIYTLNDSMSSTSCLQTLYKFIRDFGCPAHLRSDFANNLSNSSAWKRITFRFVTNISASEPHKHAQNTVEQAWQDLQKQGEYAVNTMNVSSTRRYALY